MKGHGAYRPVPGLPRGTRGCGGNCLWIRRTHRVWVANRIRLPQRADPQVPGGCHRV